MVSQNPIMIRILIRTLISCLVLTLPAWPVFENGPAEAQIKAMGGASLAVPLDYAFMQNPANISLEGREYLLSLTTGLGLEALDDVLPLNVAVLSKLPFNKYSALGLGIDFTAFTYSGEYPGLAQGLLWRELIVQAMFTFMPLSALRIGAGLKYLHYGTGALIHSRKPETGNYIDISLGMVFNWRNLYAAFAGDNILGIKDVPRRMGFGIAYEFRDFIVPALDILLPLDRESFNLNLGAAFKINDRFNVLSGLSFLDNFHTFIFSLGTRVAFTRVSLAYSFNYNVALLGAGRHSITIGFHF